MDGPYKRKGKTMKILILSCNTGQGHNTAGKAVAEAFERRRIAWEMKDVMQFASHSVSKKVEDIYVKVTTKTPWLFYGAYKAGEWISSSKRKSPVYLANISYARNLYAYIKKEQIDAVVMPHLFPAEALTYIRRHFDKTIPCYGIATDYTCIPFWEETELDYYFVPPQEAYDSFVQKGIPPKKLLPTGIPVSEKFYGNMDKDKAREILNLPKNKTIFLVMTGSMGYGETTTLVEGLAKQGRDGIAIVVMTGHNLELKQRLEREEYGVTQVEALPYTDRISLYMDACDVLLTKPGGLTSTEAAVKCVPMIHTKPIPGCETMNADFFSKHGLAVCTDTTSSAVSEAFLLAGDADRQTNMKQQQKNVIPERAADTICSFILQNFKDRREMKEHTCLKGCNNTKVEIL